MNSLRVTIASTAFPHLVYHLVLTYSNVEAVRVCFSESFEALAEGFAFRLTIFAISFPDEASALFPERWF
ncbi:hypothetical protein SB861_45455 [Paraburkholderia sp. SIMBA_049]